MAFSCQAERIIAVGRNGGGPTEPKARSRAAGDPQRRAVVQGLAARRRTAAPHRRLDPVWFGGAGGGHGTRQWKRAMERCFGSTIWRSAGSTPRTSAPSSDTGREFLQGDCLRHARVASEYERVIWEHRAQLLEQAVRSDAGGVEMLYPSALAPRASPSPPRLRASPDRPQSSAGPAAGLSRSCTVGDDAARS